jgi:4-hydroxybenzoate polyprenyltransferase
MTGVRPPSELAPEPRRSKKPSKARFESLPARSEGPLAWRLGGALLSLRPHQWVKNVFVLAPVVFAREVFAPELLLRAASAFGMFCLLASAVYTLNDVADIEADRVHRLKRHRPIASGRVPVAWARAMTLVLVVFTLSAAPLLGWGFFAAALAYFALNLAYSFELKRIAYLDVSCISAGFVLRVVAGGLATGITVSSYLLLCTALISLFLGFGKRRHELAAAHTKGARQRAALESYTVSGLERALYVTAALTSVSYLVYTLDSRTRAFFKSDWLWPSTLFVVLGVLRFLQIVRHRPRAESPTQEILRDGPFVAILLFWVGLVMWVVYQLRPA